MKSGSVRALAAIGHKMRFRAPSGKRQFAPPPGRRSLPQHPTEGLILRQQLSIALSELLQLGLQAAIDAFLKSSTEAQVDFISKRDYRVLPVVSGAPDGKVENQLPALNGTNALSDIVRDVFPGSEDPSMAGLVVGGFTLKLAWRHGFSPSQEEPACLIGLHGPCTHISPMPVIVIPKSDIGQDGVPSRWSEPHISRRAS
jgi:hypothetical protein